MPQQVTNGLDVGVGKHITLVPGLVILPALSSICYQGGLYSLDLASKPLAAMSKGWGQVSDFHLLRVSSPGHTPSRPVLLCCLGKVVRATLPSAVVDEGQGQLSSSYDLKTSFPTSLRC